MREEQANRDSPGAVLAGCGLLRRGDLLEEEYAFFVGRYDVEQAVAVEIGDDELGADAALVVDFMRGEGGVAVGAFGGLEPEEPGGLVGAGLVACRGTRTVCR